MVWGLLPNELKGSIYDHARKIMGYAYLLLASVTAIFYLSKSFNHVFIEYSSTINLSLYYILSIYISRSLFYLMGSKAYYSAKKFKTALRGYVLYLIPIWGVVFFFEERIVYIVHGIGAIVLVFNIALTISRFFKVYKRAIRLADNYYSENIETSIDWIRKIIYFIIILGAFSGFAALSVFLPRWVAILYLFYTIFVFSYIFVNFQNFMIKFSYLTRSHENSNLENLELIPSNGNNMQGVFNLNNENTRQFVVKLEEWVNSKSFIDSSLTIQNVATTIGTNRTYLSGYINNVYNCSFKEWITVLRIEEAKYILSTNSYISINDVATMVGFTSLSSFSRTFTRYNSCPPLKWRKINTSELIID